MRTLCKVALVLGLAALVASPVLAQGGRPPGGGGRGGLGMLIQNKSVQEEIKLDKDQIDKAVEAFKKFGEDNRDSFGKVFNPQTSAEERAEITKKLAEGAEKVAKDVLKPEQLARLKQIALQQKHLDAYKDEDVVKVLKLTDEQKKDIETLAADVTKSVDEIRRDSRGDRTKQEEAQKKITAIRTEASEKVEKMLTADQKKAIEHLMGKAFELKFEPRPPQPQR